MVRKTELIADRITHGKRKKHISVRMEDFSRFGLNGFVGTF
jgi:hypothetical protein